MFGGQDQLQEFIPRIRITDRQNASRKYVRSILQRGDRRGGSDDWRVVDPRHDNDPRHHRAAHQR